MNSIQNLEASLRRSSKCGGFFDIDRKEKRLDEIESLINGQADFWSDAKKSTPILKEKKNLENLLSQGKAVASLRDDLQAALELATDGNEEYLEEAENLLLQLKTQISDIEIRSILGGELDTNSALMTVNAGAGGTESCDWAAMIIRMYLRYAERKGWQTSLIDEVVGDEAGTKSATFEINGEFAYGLLKAESGVHRLVRISPFDSNARRHTSFCSVFVTPIIDDEIEIEINPTDLRIDTYRSSGAGGQHVNKTDSAVRITHLPTNTVVQSQTQRSQHQNKDKAMKLLKSKLYDLEMQKRQGQKDAQEASKTDISFGHQIRSYVLHPYKMVKDHRTNMEFHSPDEVLNGDIEGFINKYLIEKTLGNAQ